MRERVNQSQGTEAARLAEEQSAEMGRNPQIMFSEHDGASLGGKFRFSAGGAHSNGARTSEMQERSYQGGRLSGVDVQDRNSQ